MRIVRPISAHDADLLEASIALMEHFGHLENHSIVLSPAQSVAHLAEEASLRLLSICPDVTVLNIPFEGQDTWPQSPNQHWTMTMEALRENKSTDPIFWMELDCDPRAPKWADMLEHAWRIGRKAFCGKIVPKPSRNAAGAIVYEPGDDMMMGCAIYPHNITHLSNWDALVKGFHVGTNAEPFDVFLRGWMQRIGWTNTDLIGDRWNTINYREGLLCDPGPTQFKNRDHSRTDVTGTCVLHGCKDGTHAQLVLEGRGESVIKPEDMPPPVKPAQPSKAPATAQKAEPVTPATERTAQPKPPAPPAPDIIAQLREIVEASQREVTSKIDALTEEVTGLRIALEDAVSARDAEAQYQEANNGAEVPSPPDIATIRGIVNGSPSALRVNALASVLQMDPDDVKKIIDAEDSGMHLRNGYVRLTT